MNKKSPIQQFRDAVYQKMLKRADAGLDLLDALTTAGHVASPVALSEQVPFRRKFSMVYDTLDHGEIDADALTDVLCRFQPSDSETLAGFEVYAADTTFNERPHAETLPEREWLKHSQEAPARAGWYVWWSAERRGLLRRMCSACQRTARPTRPLATKSKLGPAPPHP